jgi:hypothetical protein
MGWPGLTSTNHWFTPAGNVLGAMADDTKNLLLGGEEGDCGTGDGGSGGSG